MKKTYSVASKLVSMFTVVGLVGLGCTGAQESDPVDPGSREVTLEIWTNLPDDSGARVLTSMGSNTSTLAELLIAERTFVIDGGESRDLARVRQGQEIVVPLNTGETATLVRAGDRLELARFTGDEEAGDLPRGAVEAVRLLDDGVEVFLAGAAGTGADAIIRISGLEDLEAERGALVTSLALEVLLVSLEDTEQMSPPVAIALIAGALGAAWMATCGGLATYCAWNCQWWSGFQTTCAGLTVTVNPFSVTLGGGYSCRCI